MAQVQRVFLSYARENLGWAREVARVLRGEGIQVFLDVDSIRAGDVWPKKLLGEVKAADRVRLGWSRFAAQSEWVRREYTEALRKPPGALLIDLLDETPMPEELRSIQCERSALNDSAADRHLGDPARPLPDRPQPSHLLRPEYGVVPFYGRQSDLDHAARWCDADGSFAAELYTGPGGVGKTRLMVQLCGKLQQRGWDARFLDTRSFDQELRTNANAAAGLLRVRVPTLIVIDYAETRTDQVRALLDEGLKRKSDPPVRLILLARSEGDWWVGLLGETFELQREFGDCLYDLKPVANGIEECEQIIHEAQVAFGRILERPVSERLTLDLSRPEFERILYLHLTALSSLLEEPTADPSELLDVILQHEERYWWGASERDKQDRRLRPALASSAALIGLVGGCEAGMDDVLRLLKNAPHVEDLSRLEKEQVAHVFMDLYGHRGRVEPLQPDLLCERLVTREFKRIPELRTAWLIGARPEQLRHGLTVLDRIASDTPEARHWLSAVIQQDLEQLAPLAVKVAMESGDPIGQVLAECLRSQPNPTLSYELESDCPEQTVALLELGVVATAQALAYVAETGGPPQTEKLPERGRLLNNLGNRLSDLGRWEDALKATAEAVEIRRKLASSRPDAFLPDLAMSLNNVGNRLSNLGRREDALKATKEAVEHYRKLASSRPDAFLPNVAGSLNNLGNMLSNLGRWEDALEATAEAVEHYRKLASSRPDAFLPDLASSLNNVGNRLSNLGRREDALKATKEAVEIHLPLFRRFPDSFRSRLENSAANYLRLCSEVGVVPEPELARSIEEAVGE